MRRRSLPPTQALLSILALAVLLPVGAAGQEQAETAVPLDWAPGRLTLGRVRSIEFRYDPRPGVRLPADVRDGRYGVVRLKAAPDGRVPCALDLAPGHERLWIDTDTDGHLDDERALTWRRDGLRWTAAATLSLSVGEGPTVPVDLRLRRGAFSPDDEFKVDVGAHRTGALELGGRLRLVGLEDDDGDLRFTTGGDDFAVLDLDGDGELDGRPDSTERVALGTALRVAGRLVTVTATADGSQLVLLEGARSAAVPLPVSGAVVAPPENTFDALMTRLGAERRKTAAERLVTIWEIGALGTRDALALLEHTARGDADATVRRAAATALGNSAFLEFGAETVAALALGSDVAVARGAMEALHRMGAPERGATYAEILGGSASPKLVRDAARYAAGSDDAIARGAVLRAIRERTSHGARLAAYEGARTVPDGVPAQGRLAAAEDEHQPLRLLALEDLVAGGDGRARRLVQQAAADGLSARSQLRLLPLLARLGDSASVDALLILGRAASRRQAALDLLRRLDRPGTTGRLIAALESSDSDVREIAAQALGDRNDSRIGSVLLARLTVETEAHVREDLLVALGEQGDVRAIAAIDRAAREGDGGPRMLYEALATPWMRGVPEALVTWRRGLKDESWRTRELALETAVAMGDPALLPDIRKALNDDHRVVRRTAIEALGRLRERASVRPLIDRLGVETNHVNRASIGTTLFRLTAVNLYDQKDLWEQWWAEHGETFRVPATIPVLPPAAAGGTMAPEPPRFYGIPIETDSVVFVIDQSGSMGSGPMRFDGQAPIAGTKFATAVKELLGAVAALENEVDVNVVFFATGVTAWRKRPQPLSPRTREALKSFLARQAADGSTNLYNGLERGLLTSGVETVVLLSDGAPTHGKHVQTPKILQAVRSLNAKRGIEVHCVAIGGHSELLRRLAAENGGEYVRR